MALQKELSAEQLPRLPVDDDESQTEEDSLRVPGLGTLPALSEEELTEKLETVLKERIQGGDKQALFQLGQVYFEQGDYENATKYFERAAEQGDYQAMFQLGVIYYDGLGGSTNHKLGYENMLRVASATSKRSRHLVRAAQYNVGRAFYQGYGVKQSDNEAERYWLLAADDGNPKASIKAQTCLGLYYADEDHKDLKKAFFWHSEACGNGSLESQGALGVMYLNGLGCKKDVNSAFICLREAAERGNVYAMGHLVSYYYKRKLHTKTVELAIRVAQFTDPEQIGEETDCLPSFVAKGIAMAAFYYARCLHSGLGVKQNTVIAKTYYSKSYALDPDVCAELQRITQQGAI